MYVRSFQSAALIARKFLLSGLAIAFLMVAGAVVGELLYAVGFYPMPNPRSRDWKPREFAVLWRPILVIGCSLIGLAVPSLVRVGMPKLRVATRLWWISHNRSQSLRVVEIVLFAVLALSFAWLAVLFWYLAFGP